MTVFNVRHVTTYRYKRQVRLGAHRIFFRPRDSYDQRLLHAAFQSDPATSAFRWTHDVFGNCLATVDFDVATEEVRFETVIHVDHRRHDGPDPAAISSDLALPVAYSGDEAADLAALTKVHFRSDAVAAWARRFVDRTLNRNGRAAGDPPGAFCIHAALATICAEIHQGFTYARRSARGTQTPEATLGLRRGACRDFALLMMEAARSLGLAARFVTGYIYVPSRGGSNTLGGGSTHAWCEVYLPGLGWAEFDPTNGIVGNRDLIRVAVAREPGQVVPLSGAYFGKAGDLASLVVQVNVTVGQDGVAADAA